MENIEDTMKKEIEHLEQDNEVFDLQSLIIDGEKAEVPITFIYPNTNKTVGAMIKPISTDEYYATLKKSNKFKLNFILEILKKSLFNMDGSPFPNDLIGKLPAGVGIELLLKINEISGIKQDEEGIENLGKELLGF